MAIQLLRGTTEAVAKKSADLTLQPGQPLYLTDRNYLVVGNESKPLAEADLEPIKVKKLEGYFGETLAVPASSADQYCVSPVQEEGTTGQKSNYLQLQAPKFRLKGSSFKYEITSDSKTFTNDKDQILGRVVLSPTAAAASLGGLSLIQGVISQGNAVQLSLSLNRQGVFIPAISASNDSKLILLLQDSTSSRELNWYIKQTFYQDLVGAGNNIVCSPEGSTSQRSKWILHCPTISIYDKDNIEQAGYKIRYVDALPSEREPNSIYIVKEYTDVSTFA